MRYLNPLFLFLVIVGGLNWLLVGVAKIDLVAALTGQTFGETNLISSAIYMLVGISAIGLVPTLVRWVASPRSPRRLARLNRPAQEQPIDRRSSTMRGLRLSAAIAAAALSLAVVARRSPPASPARPSSTRPSP